MTGLKSLDLGFMMFAVIASGSKVSAKRRVE
jgi:hypothetical protein